MLYNICFILTKSAAEESAVELEFVELAQAVAETAIAAAAIAAKIFLIFMLRFSLFVHSM